MGFRVFIGGRPLKRYSHSLFVRFLFCAFCVYKCFRPCLSFGFRFFHEDCHLGSSFYFSYSMHALWFRSHHRGDVLHGPFGFAT